MFPKGLDTLKGFAANMPEGFSYQIGNVIADEDQGLVAIHFRVVGFAPEPMIGVDNMRVSDGKTVEHWDVLQAEVTDTVSGNPMWPRRSNLNSKRRRKAASLVAFLLLLHMGWEQTTPHPFDNRKGRHGPVNPPKITSRNRPLVPTQMGRWLPSGPSVYAKQQIFAGFPRWCRDTAR